MMRLTSTILMLTLGGTAAAQWQVQISGVTSRLRGVCAVDDRTAWASGAGSTILLTTDGGATWRKRPAPDAEDRDCRDVQAFDDRSAFVLAIGEGEKSRIFKTTDGGDAWTLRHVNRDASGFLDAIAFWDRSHGLALGDPVDGRFVILATDDGGETWDRVGLDMPEALQGEGAFAASGTCLAVQGGRFAWFGTGGGRIFRSENRGRSWTVHTTPIKGSDSSGIFSLAFRDAEHGVAVGGDYKDAAAPGPFAAVTSDGGRTWSAPLGAGPSGYRSGVALLPGAAMIAVGPAGADRSDDGGMSWRRLGDAGFHAVAFAESFGWAVGEDGRIGRHENGCPHTSEGVAPIRGR